MKNWPKFLTIAGLASLAFYAVTGVGWWAPVPDGGDGFLRGMLLSYLHIGAVLAWPVSKTFP